MKYLSLLVAALTATSVLPAHATSFQAKVYCYAPYIGTIPAYTRTATKSHPKLSHAKNWNNALADSSDKYYSNQMSVNIICESSLFRRADLTLGAFYWQFIYKYKTKSVGW
ncbi:MAG: hypothetical protein LJE68_11630 [Rhodobacter sp.]|nr:hypothetical protein [Rhodobacter sp.]